MEVATGGLLATLAPECVQSIQEVRATPGEFFRGWTGWQLWSWVSPAEILAVMLCTQ